MLCLSDEIFDKLTKLKERREFLEQCLKSKCAELTKICIGEAELTGKLPVETPLGPDGCLPRFRSVMRSVSLNTEDFLKIQQSNIKQVNFFTYLVRVILIERMLKLLL